MADPFYDARNALALGNYHQAVAEASGTKTDARKAEDIAAFHAEKEVLLALAQTGLGQGDAVVAQLKAATCPILVAVREWAVFCSAMKNLSGDIQSDPVICMQLKKLTEAAEVIDPARTQIAVLAAAALLAVGDNAGALKLSKEWLNDQRHSRENSLLRLHMELRVIVVEALLRMGRTEMARSEVKAMEQADEESMLTVLCSGITNLYEGIKTKEAYQTALRRFKELTMSCGQSVLASNLTALAQIQLGEYTEAERTLLDVLAMKSGDSDTTANLAVISAHSGKGLDSTGLYTRQAVATSGPWSRSFSAASAALDAAIEEFTASA
ncbi:coatomer subunit epsilon [Trypanosoma equiperdum]|uniref:Coatomer subunit epsilon n=4 Tax=Trypanozoon TaxID=39700 RepID=Q381U5_TRYB2|nr:coatomer epsilon subunit, putative [Trypanosoma brucei gambiense DAL972]XP_829548.1 coatomer subunit epsilon [Trypanosoma brucei brucei TREU927]RHW68169.1 coatomer subunit epsilon [Trypanosoma brucei equiperdum]SCU65691.1 coatomer subunit epsilon [Trypanosoma equiperdum]EAN80436.1 coatomer epsilon subunit, putative [Trypanosoma brucei brucei TREU927]CBH18551.1 coatomer epsilon subunit, putative [Trypanosoma brucei gambiense DAL972]|eukprot:XP_011780815.1 coatomer epsilon subunit, putative [Trypanosoma brucei gambiense DAL972]